MASVKFTFWTSNTQQANINVPYLGDVTSAPNGRPNDYPWYIVSSTGGFNVIKKLDAIDAGRRATNLLILSSGGSLTYGTSNSMVNGISSIYQTYDTSSISRIETFGSGGSNSNMSARNDRCDFAGLALAVVSGTMYLGFMLTGTSIVTGEKATFFMTNTATNSQFKYIYDNTIHKGDPYNPYSPGEYSGPGGGIDSNFSEYSDTVPIGDLPDETISAVGSGFSTIFTPSKSQLQHLQSIMWGSDIVGFFQNMVENIGEMFVSLGILPFKVPEGRTVSVKWFGLIDTAVSLTLAAAQWIRFDMGSIVVGSDDERIFTTDSALDYTPYAKLGIYLPFVGFQDLDIDECRKAPLHLFYDIDIMSGACVAKIEVAGNILYQFSGNCLCQIPLSSQDAQTLFTNAVNVGLAAAGVGTAAAVAGAGNAVSAEQLSAGKITQTRADSNATQGAASVSSAESKLAACTANAAVGMKPSYTRTGAVGGACALLAEKTPYLYLKTSKQSMPEGYEKVCGFPCNIYGYLREFSGFTVVEDIRLNNLVATSKEVEEIYQLLKSGVII